MWSQYQFSEACIMSISWQPEPADLDFAPYRQESELERGKDSE
jgi:hypothetical protein